MRAKMSFLSECTGTFLHLLKLVECHIRLAEPLALLPALRIALTTMVQRARVQHVVKEGRIALTNYLALLRSWCDSCSYGGLEVIPVAEVGLVRCAHVARAVAETALPS